MSVCIGRNFRPGLVNFAVGKQRVGVAAWRAAANRARGEIITRPLARCSTLLPLHDWFAETAIAFTQGVLECSEEKAPRTR